MSSICCKASTHVGYYNADKSKNQHAAIGTMGTYCDKCGKLCKFVDEEGVVRDTRGNEVEMKFDLNANEVRAYEEFMAKLPKKYKNASKHITFTFGNGIGTAVGVSVSFVGLKTIEMDITDYKSW